MSEYNASGLGLNSLGSESSDFYSDIKEKIDYYIELNIGSSDIDTVARESLANSMASCANSSREYTRAGNLDVQIANMNAMGQSGTVDYRNLVNERNTALSNALYHEQNANKSLRDFKAATRSDIQFAGRASDVAGFLSKLGYLSDLNKMYKEDPQEAYKQAAKDALLTLVEYHYGDYEAVMVQTGFDVMEAGYPEMNAYKKMILDQLIDEYGRYIPPYMRKDPSLDEANAQSSPIILDLDADGIETLSLNNGVYFDLDNNQFAEKTGWVSSDDGLLVRDINGDGLIDNGGELFGNNTLLKNGMLARNGYEALKDVDDNKNGMIDAEDSIWKELSIWQDKNKNGVVDHGELKSLDELEIKNIATGYTNSTTVDANGNSHKQESTITFENGGKGISEDVWFDVNAADARYDGEYLLSVDILSLPNMNGSGNMANLHISMSKNENLRNMVEQFVSDPKAAKQSDLLETILFEWAGVSDVDPKSWGQNYDARKIAFLEVITGDHLNGSNIDNRPNALTEVKQEYQQYYDFSLARLLAQTMYKEQFDLIILQFSQGKASLNLNEFSAYLDQNEKNNVLHFVEIGKAFSMLTSYLINPTAEIQKINARMELYIIGSVENDTFKNDLGVSHQYIFSAGHGKDVFQHVGVSSKVDNLHFIGVKAEASHFSRQKNDLVIHAFGSEDSVTINNYFLNGESNTSGVRNYSFEFDDVTLTESDLLKLEFTSNGGDADEALTGWYGIDLMYGAGGNDTLKGGGGNDVLNGGAGTDYLYGSSGEDTYQFTAGHGKDYVSDSAGSGENGDVLRFTGAASGAARFSREGANLIIQAYGSDDSVTVINYFAGTVQHGGIYSQFSFVFDDATLTEADLARSGMTYNGTDVGNNATGLYGVDVMNGGGGNDTLQGGGGNDVLNGGAGNDSLYGSSGEDTYQFTAGHGKDYVTDTAGSGENGDILRFTGAASGAARFSREGTSLIIQAYGSDDSVTVSNYFAGTDQPGGIYRQFSFVFDDATLTESDLARSGMTYNGTDVVNNATGWYAPDLMYGADGNDTLQGGGGNDVLNGGAGNDFLYGNSGEDTYQFTAGHGKDHVSDSAGSGENGDILRFTGAASGAARFSREGNNLIIQAYGSDDSVTVSNYFAGTDQPGGIYRQFSFVFDDATLTESDLARSGMTYNGTDVVNNATGWYAPDLMYGADGNDTLQGGGGNDVLNGGAGNDFLYGNSGEDIYQFTAGHGKDHVSDSAGSGENGDILRFTGAASGAARFSREGNNLIIQAYGSDDSVTVSNYFAGTDQPGGIYRQFSFVFDDATLTEADLARSGMTYNGTDLANNATGWYAPDFMYGAGGNDTLQGGGGNDVLNGGAGNDSLNGNSGEDTYQFTAGHGNDYVYDNTGAGEHGDILRFTGANAGSALFSRDGRSLVIKAYGSDDSVTVSNYFAGTDQPGGIYRQFSFVFDDATLTESDLARSGITYNGTEVSNNITGWYGVDLMNGGGGNDSLSGGSGNDVLNGGVGNDSLYGGAGQDTYLFANGHGNDRVTDSAGKLEGKDIIEFSDLNLTDLWFSKSNSNLLITESGSQDSVEVMNWYSNADSQNKIIHTHDGYEIDAAQVQQLVEAMSTFAATHSELSAADQQTGFMHSVSVSSYLEAAK
ncbi:Ca2+-binding RTX toxin-like protein [Rahnella inusitata]|nr:Ca2+-binding RTX toxin-like protein [Rahnella inusitata]